MQKKVEIIEKFELFLRLYSADGLEKKFGISDKFF